MDLILDRATVLRELQGRPDYEIKGLFEFWLARRLLIQPAPNALQLARWLYDIKMSDDVIDGRGESALKKIFSEDFQLFQETINYLIELNTENQESLYYFAFSQLRNMVPINAWPIQPSKFYLGMAEKENNILRAGEYLHIFMGFLPKEGADLGDCERAFRLIEANPAIVARYPDWGVIAVPDHIEAKRKRDLELALRDDSIREENIAKLMAKIADIEAGRDVNALIWAAKIYFGYNTQLNKRGGPRARLLYCTNEEIVERILDGFINYLEFPIDDTIETIVIGQIEGRIYDRYLVVALAALLRFSHGISVADDKFPQVFLISAYFLNTYKVLDGFDIEVLRWLKSECRHRPTVVRSSLAKAWTLYLKNGVNEPPLLNELLKDVDSHSFLASIIVDVLSGFAGGYSSILCRMLTFLMARDHESLSAIVDDKISGKDIVDNNRTVWLVASFLIDRDPNSTVLADMVGGGEEDLWKVIEVVSGYESWTNTARKLAPFQRGALVQLVGSYFPLDGVSVDGWIGDRGPWGAKEFVKAQIVQLAASDIRDARSVFDKLVSDNKLSSYHEFIKSQFDQQLRRRREAEFYFPSPQEIENMINSKIPASPNDLLNFTILQLKYFAKTSRNTSNEDYKAFWNFNDRRPVAVKREEDCSSILASFLTPRLEKYGISIMLEYHMFDDKECDIAIIQGLDRILPIEAKHHYNAELWVGWRSQLDLLYSKDAKASGYGIYLVYWTGVSKSRKLPKPPAGVPIPTSCEELEAALKSLIPEAFRFRLQVCVIDLSLPLRSNTQ